MGWWQFVKAVASAVEKAIVASAGPIASAIIEAVVVVVVVGVIFIESLMSSSENCEPGENCSNHAEAGAFNYHASIYRNDTYICSGAFIGTYFIVTVAQCVYAYVNNRQEISKLKVYVASYEVPSYSRFEYAVEEIIIHPSFEAQRLSYNFAVIKLRTKVTGPPCATPITLPSPRMNTEKTEVIVSGFRNMGISSVLTGMTKSKMEIIQKKLCDAYFAKFISTSLKFCVIPSKKWKPCQTSSGGPAVNKDEILMGLFAMENRQGCAKDLPEIFVDVSKFIDFIKVTTGQH